MRRRTDGKIGKRCLSSLTSPQNAGRSAGRRHARHSSGRSPHHGSDPGAFGFNSSGTAFRSSRAYGERQAYLCQQADKESRRSQNHKNSEADFESTLRQDMGETDSERREETGNRRNHHNTDQGYEA
jgi:hypothetical protein